MLIMFLWAWSISTNLLMCVPLYSWGRLTYMLISAMVCWEPFLLSSTTIGYFTFLTPTLSILMFRGSCMVCTSFMSTYSSVRRVGIIRFPHAHFFHHDAFFADQLGETAVYVECEVLSRARPLFEERDIVDVLVIQIGDYFPQHAP